MDLGATGLHEESGGGRGARLKQRGRTATKRMAVPQQGQDQPGLAGWASVWEASVEFPGSGVYS